MSDPRNRRVLGLVGIVLLVLSVLSICLGAHVFGVRRGNGAVLDAASVRRWNQGGWISFALVVAVGVVAALLGQSLVRGQLRRNDGRTRTPIIAFGAAEGDRGETTLRAAALSHTLESDFVAIPDVHGARVGLFGPFPTVELRAQIDVGDDADFDLLPTQVEEKLGRFEATTGIRPDPVQITVRFTPADRQRRIA